MDNTTLTDDLIAEIEPQGKGKTIHHDGRMYYPAEMVNSLIAKNRSLRAENAELARWKAEQMEVMSPVLDYAHSLKIAPLGESVTKALIDDHKSLRADAERIADLERALIKVRNRAEIYLGEGEQMPESSLQALICIIDTAMQATK